MPTPSEKLADALEELHGLQEKDLVAIKSTEISRVNRELLVKTGYLKEVSKGGREKNRTAFVLQMQYVGRMAIGC